MHERDIPKFESRYLADFCAALGNRFKAIQLKANNIDVDRFVGVIGSQRYETLELRLLLNEPPGRRIGLDAWNDRWCVVDVHISANGIWLVEWTSSGRLMGDLDALITALEHTIDAAAGKRETLRVQLDRVWRPFIGKGPVDTLRQTGGRGCRSG